MRISCFDFVTHLGGAQRATTDFMCTLKEKGYEVDFIDAYGALPKHEELAIQSGLEYRALHRKARYTTIGFAGRPIVRMFRALSALPEILTVAHRLRKYLKDSKPHLVIVISAKALYVLAFASIGLKIRIIFWCHNKYIKKNLLKQKWGVKVNKFFCLSSTTKDASFVPGLIPDKISILPNAIDIEDLRALSELPILTPLPDLDKPIRILVPATLLPAKGQDCAIRVLGSLVRDGYDAILYLAGDCGVTGWHYRDELAALASLEGVSERVHFLGWREDIPQIIRLVTVMLLLSHSEGMPLCIMEAMALRCPVIATPVGSVREMLKDGDLGKIVEINDVEGCKKAIVGLTNDPLLGEVLNDAFNSITTRYSKENQISCFISGVGIAP